MPERVIEEAIEKWTGETLTPEEIERIKVYHPICKLRVLLDLVRAGIRDKERILREIETRCAGKEHGIAKLSAELKRLVTLTTR